MGCIEASVYTTGTVLGVHSSLEDCEQQCGVCCIPTCPSNLNSFKTTQPDGCVVQSLIPFEDSTAISLNEFSICSAGGYGDWIYFETSQNNNNVMGFLEQRGPSGATVRKFPDATHWNTLVAEFLSSYVYDTWELNRGYSLVRSGTKPSDLTWAPGYPNGVYFIEIINFNTSVTAGSMDIGAKYTITSWGGEPQPTTDDAGAIYFSRAARKVKYFQCENGILIDKTSEAFSNGSNNYTTSYNDAPPGSAPNTIVNVGTLVDYDFTRTTVIAPCFKEDPISPCCPSYEGTDPCPGNDLYPNGAFYQTISSTFINESKFGEFGFLEDIPLYPSISEVGTAGATTLVYECNDTITQSGCLLGGVLNPSGVPLGIWHSGQNCTTFNCNA